MNGFRLGVAHAVGLAALLAAGSASAQSDPASCACLVDRASVADVENVAVVAGATGTVNFSTPQGWQAAAVGQTLGIGDDVETGAGSSATVQVVPSCSVTLGELTTMTIRETGANYCVALDVDEQPVAGGDGTLAVVGGIAVAAGVGAAVALGGGDDDPVSGQ
jgi:hypothetical protein